MRLTPAKLTFGMILVVSGLIGAYVAKKVRATDEVPHRYFMTEGRNYVNVPVTVSDLPLGTTIAAEHLRSVRLPAAAVARGVIVHTPQLIGRTLNEAVAQADPIRLAQLVPDEPAPDLAGDDMQHVAAADPVGADSGSMHLADDDNQNPAPTPQVTKPRAAGDSDRFVAEIFSGTARQQIEFRDGRRVDR